MLRFHFLLLGIALFLMPQGLFASVDETDENKIIEASKISLETPEQGINGEPTPQALDHLERAAEQLDRPADQVSDVEKKKIILKEISGLTEAMVIGHKKALGGLLVNVMNRLHSPEEDDGTYHIALSSIPILNAMIDTKTREVTVFLGLFAFVDTEDKLAFILRHEMVHGNPKIFKATKDDPEIARIMDMVPELTQLEPSQREEIRADLGAIKGLIQAGYNPWEGFRMLQTIGRLEKDHKKKGIVRLFVDLVRGTWSMEEYFQTHPHTAIRMAAVKSYIEYISNKKQDISELIQKTQPFSANINIFRLRSKLFAFPFTSKWFGRSIDAAVFYYPILKYGLNALVAHSPAAFRHWLSHTHQVVLPYFNSITRLIPEFIKNGSLQKWFFTTVIYVPIGALLYTGIRNYRKIPGALKKIGNGLFDIFGSLNQLRAQGRRLLNQSETYSALIAQGDFADHKGFIKYVRESLRQIYEDSLKINLRRLRITFNFQLPNKKTKRQRQALVDALTLYMPLCSEDEQKELQNVFSELIPLRKDVFYGRAMVGAIGFDPLLMLVLDQELMADAEYRDNLKNIMTFVRPQEHMLLDRIEGTQKADDDVEEIDNDEEQTLAQMRLDVDKKKTDPFFLYELLNKTFTQYHQMQVSEKIELLKELNHFQLTHVVTSLVQDDIQNIFEAVFKKHQEEPTEEQQDLVVNLDRLLGTLNHSIYTKNKLNLEKIVETFRSLRSTHGFSGTLQSLALSRSILRYDSVPAFHKRFWQDRRDVRSLKKFLQDNIHSVTDLDKFLTEEVNHQTFLDGNVRDVFLETLLDNPSWIQNQDDIQTIVMTPHFWPSSWVNPYQGRSRLFTASSSFTASNLDRELYHSLSQLLSNSSENQRFLLNDLRAAEALHQMMFKRLKELNQMPQRVDEKFKLWDIMTRRSLSATSDAYIQEIFSELIKTFDEPKVSRIANTILNSGRVWDPSFVSKLLEFSKLTDPDYVALKDMPPSAARLEVLQKSLIGFQARFQKYGYLYPIFLEHVSEVIESTAAESALIERFKYPKTGERAEDTTLRGLSVILTKLLDWKHKDQWSFLLFLKGDIDPTDKIKNAFSYLGPERVRRLFLNMPVVARVSLLDSFLGAPGGLLGKINTGRGYAKQMIQYLLNDIPQEQREIVEDSMEAFLYSLEKTGSGELRSLVLSYFFSRPKSEMGRIGLLLKEFCQAYGTTGVKLAQSIVAAEILPEQETAELRAVQEDASAPQRQERYEEFALVAEGKLQNQNLGSLLGAASLKYTQRIENGVLKTLRAGTLAHKNVEFIQLAAMADYLSQKNRKRYGIFPHLVEAAKQAVLHEMSFSDEVKRSTQARVLYEKYSGGNLTVKVPREEYLSDRAVFAEFAEGRSFFKLPEEQRPLVAEHLLRIENDILFGRGEGVFDFDPDRHPGNSKFLVDTATRNQGTVVHVQYSPIDWGQLQSVSVEQRAQIVDLFALAQIATHVGSIRWVIEKVREILSIDENSTRILAGTLSQYFPQRDVQPMHAYYALLAAIQDAGVQIPMVFYNFTRGIMQLKQYEAYISATSQVVTPRQTLETLVRGRVAQWQPEISSSMSLWEKIRHWWRTRKQPRAQDQCQRALSSGSR